ncbi:hypothetical protein CIB84_015835 [Bambusicola thoracicus]|uniref:Uncharacterized protein n=1 Tax=Bambusicola thoracicus TaxID=9083 RepID=A0A2P4S8J8_BAMTH|nr:hypothetical protein CIB84_015835 [Bambusicola thoracicus]
MQDQLILTKRNV